VRAVAAMEESLLSFVMRNVPDEWEDVPVYNKSYELFTVPPGLYSREYQKVEQFFHGIKIGRIQRVQNPFQYGRYMLRREMVRTNYEVSETDPVVLLIFILLRII
jgi:hypothetical protein